MPLAPGTKLGPYEVDVMLGAGGMGEVYRARDTRLGRDVAIKVLPSDLASDADRLRRFEHEARSVGALNHPNILSIFDLGETGGVVYLVTELLEGETLRERMSGAALTARKAIDYGIQTAQGLAAAHSSGIVHRDLKPENLFVTKDGRIKILDFGLAKQTAPAPQSLTQTSGPAAQTATTPGTVLGTVGYLSPEQVRGEPADHRSDIFSFGAILYEMLAGKRAFKADTSVETMSAILRNEPEEISRSAHDVPPGLERIVRRCLEKSPEERFQSARDLAFHLGELSNLSVSGMRAMAAPAPSKRRRGAILGVAVAVVALVAGYLAGSGSAPQATEIDYRQLSFRRGTITAARFAPDGDTVVYSAIWEGEPSELFTTAPGSPESRPLGLPGAGLLGLSSNGELAVGLRLDAVNGFERRGTLANLPLATSTAPREVMEDVRWADWSPDAKSLAVVRNDGGLTRLERPPGTVLFETQGWVSHPRVSPDGASVAFLEHPQPGDDRGYVALVDAKGAHRRLGPVWATIWGLAWSPDGEEIWFAGGPDASLAVRRLYAMNLEGEFRVLAISPGEMTLHDVSRGGDVLLAIEDRRRSMVGIASSETKERTLTWLDRSVAIDLSKDGALLLFHEGGKAGGPLGSVYLRKTDGSPAVRLTDGYAIAFSPDEKWALTYLPKSQREFYLVPTGAGSPRRIELTQWAPDAAFPVAMLPDNRRLVVNVRESGNAPVSHVVDLEAGTEERITPDGFGPAFVSGDGRFLVAVRAADGTWWTIPTSGGSPRPILGIEDGEAVVQLTMDGGGAYVRRDDGLVTQVFLVDVATGKRTLLRELMPPNQAGSAGVDLLQITPDGKHYVFGYTQQLSELYQAKGIR